MNIITTKKDAISFLRMAENGDQLMFRLDQLPSLIDFDPESSSFMPVNTTSTETEEETWTNMEDYINPDDTEIENSEMEQILN